MQKEIYLLVVGKLRDKNLAALEDEYLKRITLPKLKIFELKSEDDILKKCKDISPNNKCKIILLDENGQQNSSHDFSKWLYDLIESSTEKICLVIGPFQGFSEEFQKLKLPKISLSKMTYPHMWARIILVEQIYRAQTIYQGHPYHY
ncbi:MAG: 23S rRNA (pseudouridine(1915)-N(3))-methyltransferase RlmH [Bacteriovoracaceae bacterium]